MQNEMRDRLVEIFKQNGVGEAFSPLAREEWRKDTADVLIANGVVVLDTDVLLSEYRPLIRTIADMPLNEVIELIKAKREGRIIVPPCKVGDTVYEINTTFPDTPYINDFVVVALHITSGKNSLGHKKPSHAVVTPNKFMPPITKRIYLENFGKTVFLTKEEAEKALKEREIND